MKKIIAVAILTTASLITYAQKDTIPPSLKTFPPDSMMMKQDSMKQGVWPDTIKPATKDKTRVEKPKSREANKR